VEIKVRIAKKTITNHEKKAMPVHLFK